MAIKYKCINTIIAVQWYLKKLFEELPLVQKRSESFSSLPENFIERQSKDIIDICIKNFQSLIDWEKNDYKKIVYFEKYLDKSNSTIEHVITKKYLKNKLFNLYKNSNLTDTEVVKAFLSPVALINKNHTKILNKKIQIDENYPFKRYNSANITIVTHEGELIDRDTWTMNDHWNLLIKIPEFNKILIDYGIQ